MRTVAKYRYNVTFDLDEDGVIIVECPSLPACVTSGRTQGEALFNIREAMAVTIDALRIVGEPIPECDTGPEVVEFEA